MKSPPEIWAEVSDVGILARHLGEFGEIRITQLEAETTVVWEGDRARGTVELEASGWGTKVTITAEAIAAQQSAVAEEAEVVEAVQEEEADVVEDATVEEIPADEVVEEEVAAAPPVAAERRRGLFARLLRRRAEAVAVAEPEPVVAMEEPEPVVVAEPEPVAVEPEPEPAEPAIDVEAVLVGVLDDLGSAHHRPFSRG
ncbi:MAG: hypothetical protein JWQ18_2026 [Conexibacter sp.]|nr:hypothetical protein [Conexibacter sp.]